MVIYDGAAPGMTMIRRGSSPAGFRPYYTLANGSFTMGCIEVNASYVAYLRVKRKLLFNVSLTAVMLSILTLYWSFIEFMKSLNVAK
jgi:hypothetical protein